MFTEWLKENTSLLTSLGAAGGLGTPTIWAIQTNVTDDSSRLPWSLVALFVILLLTGGLVTLPQHKRELKRATEPFDKLFPLVEHLADNQETIIKALEDVKAIALSKTPPPRPNPRRPGAR